MEGVLGEALQQQLGDNSAFEVEFNAPQSNFGLTQHTYCVPGPRRCRGN